MIKLVTDTTASLPQHILDEFDIPLVPQYVHFGEETYLDSFEMTPEQFYAKQAAAADLPKTSAPPIGDFLPIFKRLVEEDPTAPILCIHPSAEVSGTVRSCRAAAAGFPDAKIRIFDSRSVSVALGLMVWEAACMAQDGAGIDDILACLGHMRDNMQVFFVVDTLEYLAKGGRIGRAAHLLGSLLDIRPILTLVNGVVESHSKARTRHRSLALMRDMVIEGAGQKPGLRLGVAHGMCEDEARPFADELCSILHPERLLFSEIGPSIGVHTGPRVLAVCWVHV